MKGLFFFLVMVALVGCAGTEVVEQGVPAPTETAALPTPPAVQAPAQAVEQAPIVEQPAPVATGEQPKAAEQAPAVQETSSSPATDKTVEELMTELGSVSSEMEQTLKDYEGLKTQFAQELENNRQAQQALEQANDELQQAITAAQQKRAALQAQTARFKQLAAEARRIAAQQQAPAEQPPTTEQPNQGQSSGENKNK